MKVREIIEMLTDMEIVIKSELTKYGQSDNDGEFQLEKVQGVFPNSMEITIIESKRKYIYNDKEDIDAEVLNKDAKLISIKSFSRMYPDFDYYDLVYGYEDEIQWKIFIKII